MIIFINRKIIPHSFITEICIKWILRSIARIYLETTSTVHHAHY